MGANGASGINLPTSTSKEECSEATVEIKIKTLDSQTHTLRVNKYVPVPALKEQIANVTGVLSEQQRLICRGKVLKDDELLSAYHVEDGHTLHLVVRQPFGSSSSTTPSFIGSSTAHELSGTRPSNPNSNTSSGLVFGPFSLTDQGDPTTDLSRIFSSVINSLGINNTGSGRARGSEGNDTSQNGGSSDTSQPQIGQSASSAGFNPLQGDFQFPSAMSLGNQHPTVIPDSSTTLTHYINHMRCEFDVNGSSLNGDSQATDIRGGQGQSHNSQLHSAARHGLPTPESLAEVILSARQLLMEQAGGCLSELARQLQDQASVTDPQVRASIQSNAIRAGVLIQNLGPLLLELGRTIMTLRMGHAPEEAIVNSGPAVFVSAASPSPIMVQAGTTFSGFPLGSPHSGHGPAISFGPGLLSRNIDIHIRRGHSASVGTTNIAVQPTEQQPSERTDASRNPVDSSVNQVHQGVSSRASSGRESTVRVVPIRTVIAIPGANRPPASSGTADSSVHPLFARLHQQILGNTNDASNPLAPGEHNTGGLGQNRVSTPVLQSASFGWTDEQLERIQNNLSTNPASVSFETGPTNGQHNSWASSSSPHGPFGGISGDRTQPCEREQIGQHGGVHAFSRFVGSEQPHPTDSGLQGTSAFSAPDQTVIDTEAQEATAHENEDGVFFSGLLRQLMPLISQNATSEPSVSSFSPGSTEQAESQNSTHVRDNNCPSDAPASKRLKKE